jgi:hypothetical protein
MHGQQNIKFTPTELKSCPAEGTEWSEYYNLGKRELLHGIGVIRIVGETQKSNPET